MDTFLFGRMPTLQEKGLLYRFTFDTPPVFGQEIAS
jgi:hypothetical protein